MRIEPQPGPLAALLQKPPDRGRQDRRVRVAGEQHAFAGKRTGLQHRGGGLRREVDGAVDRLQGAPGLAGDRRVHRLELLGVLPDVLHDELDLPYGGLRLKLGGGDNGHNGLKALRRSLGSGEFLRVRFGIGRPPGRMDAAAFVLRDFSAAERKELELEVDRAADAVEALVADGLEKAQNAFNT